MVVLHKAAGPSLSWTTGTKELVTGSGEDAVPAIAQLQQHSRDAVTVALADAA